MSCDVVSCCVMSSCVCVCVCVLPLLCAYYHYLTSPTLSGGFNEWADAHDLVVLYPQAVADSLLGNPNGCWDW